jgi:hypothetical protein
MPKSIEIFKSGNHTAMSGESIPFSESDLQAMVDAYDPALHEAPIVIGHPKTDDPAYGWVKSLKFSDGLVTAIPDQVDAEFAELNKRGMFKKVSASLYTPSAPNNPVPGVYYLRHVGFLGAQPPAIKGLKSASFSENEEGVIEFADWDLMATASLFRKIRDFFIEKFGAEAADKVLPNYEIESLQINAAQDRESNALYSESITPQDHLNQGDEMSTEDKARLEALEAENKALKQAQADFSEKEKAQKIASTHRDNEAFAEKLIAEGRLLPANKDSTVALLDSTAAIEAPVEFGEGDAKKSLHPHALLKAQLEANQKVVEFGEMGKGDVEHSTVNFSAPSGFAVDVESLEHHNKILAYAEKHGVEYEVALTKVSKD